MIPTTLRHEVDLQKSKNPNRVFPIDVEKCFLLSILLEEMRRFVSIKIAVTAELISSSCLRLSATATTTNTPQKFQITHFFYLILLARITLTVAHVNSRAFKISEIPRILMKYYYVGHTLMKSSLLNLRLIPQNFEVQKIWGRPQLSPLPDWSNFLHHSRLDPETGESPIRER